MAPALIDSRHISALRFSPNISPTPSSTWDHTRIAFNGVAIETRRGKIESHPQSQGAGMYLMYGDEADAEEGRRQKFFLYGGIFIDHSKIWTAHEQIEQLR